MAEKNKPEQGRKEEAARLIRILSTDIPGDMSVYSGLTRIKGISWSISNAICKTLKLNKNKKIQDLSQEEIKNITEFFDKPSIPSFLLNGRKDFDDGKDKHRIGSNLELKKEFNIKRLKKIKSYRGLRHALGQPVRGQRTKAHFRKNKSVGVGKKKGRKWRKWEI